MEQLTLWSEEAPANPFPLQGSAKGSKELPASCVSTFDAYKSSVLDGSSGKTYQVRSQSRAGLLSDSSFRKWTYSGMVWHGEYWMRNSSTSHNGESVCSLSEVLEICPAPKYCLTKKACEGIISRAERNGRQLPPILKTALTEYMATLSSSDTPVHPTQGGGEGALVQTDVSATIGTGNDQALFQQVFSKSHRVLPRWDFTSYEQSEVACTLNTFDTGETRANEIVCMADVTAHMAIDSDMCGTLHVGGGKPIVVIDRAAYNQGINAQYPPPYRRG